MVLVRLFDDALPRWNPDQHIKSLDLYSQIGLAAWFHAVYYANTYTSLARLMTEGSDLYHTALSTSAGHVKHVL